MPVCPQRRQTHVQLHHQENPGGYRLVYPGPVRHVHHFGLYAMPARHEWVKTRECMTDEAYDRYFRHFDPDLYDPAQWAKMAKAAGMKYAVMTAKHHEGFCLFDSQYTDYKCTTPLPAGI